MRHFATIFLSVIMVSCNAYKIEKEQVDRLSKRTIVVPLKEQAEDDLKDLKGREMKKLYEQNIEQFNETVKYAFNESWDFGNGVEFVEASEVGKYIGNREYAILNLVRGTLWTFTLNRAETIEDQGDLKDIRGADYYAHFPVLNGVAVDEENKEEKYIPFTFIPFGNNDNGREGLYSALGGIEEHYGYSKSDVYLAVQIMQTHLKTIEGRGFEGDFHDYMKFSDEGNCKQLRGETLVVNPGQERGFLASQRRMVSDKEEKEKELQEAKSDGDYEEYPYDIKVLRKEAIDEAVMNKEDYYYILWYPKVRAENKIRMVVSPEGEIMAFGRYSYLSGKLEGDLKEFNDCP